ncbi:MAG TPA: hypothetical protein VL307_19250 [Chitinophagaceae bacterium]|nr:hypothetical protein [Chitinophagaceae bacterium]
MSDPQQHPASFRDPAGFIFQYNGHYYRQVNQSYEKDFKLFHSSGLYQHLITARQLLPYVILKKNMTGSQHWYTTLLPQQLRFITYPYEWCFSQWKDAALLTLDLAAEGIKYGMVLKDATPFNVQFVDGRPMLIDSLSFEAYDETRPWKAYRQFVECFIAPILLAKYQSPALLKLFQLYPDGLPLPMVAGMLPMRSWFSMNVLLHVRLPLWLSSSKPSAQQSKPTFSRQKMTHLIGNLRSFVNALALPAVTSTWNNYYEETILSDEYARDRMEVVQPWLKKTDVQTVADIGANTGYYALAAAAEGKFTLAVDADIACLDNLYKEIRRNKVANVVTIWADLTQSSPAIGWANEERASFTSRLKVDMILALAVIHHLCISKNISFAQLALLFSKACSWLVIEFVPKTDPKVQLLLSSREDIFSFYSEQYFIEAFAAFFSIEEKVKVKDTERIIFLMKKVGRD